MANIRGAGPREKRILGIGLKLVPEKCSTWEPAADVFLTENTVVVILDLAGISTNDVEVTYAGGCILVRGYRKHPTEEKGPKSFIRMEIPHGFFEREFPLPVQCNEDSLEAAYHNGLLVITAQVKPSSKRKDIPVR